MDLGQSPISNAYRRIEDRQSMEPFFPLLTFVCEACKLVQTLDIAEPESHFHGDYAYFSSVSTSWVEHARRFAESAIDRFHLDRASLVVEVASNDGYLLQNFVGNGIPSLGIDPAENCAREAKERRNVETRVGFFGPDLARQLADEGLAADLVIANNVLAHVPDIDGFVSAFPLVLKPGAAVSFEFPHLLELMRHNQFDTIYHEHYSYLSLTALEPLFRRHGLEMVDVEKLRTHGGSLRVTLHHIGVANAAGSVTDVLEEEAAAGLRSMDTYSRFAAGALDVRMKFVEFLHGAAREGRRVVGFGAPAKATTLLNFCGIDRTLLEYTVDSAPSKQGRLIPGTNIPIHDPRVLYRDRPDCIVIFPWNIRSEIIEAMRHNGVSGAQIITAIPHPVVEAM